MELTQLSMRDVAAIEDFSGLSISALDDEGAPKGKLMAAMAWRAKLKEDPKFTWDQALDLTLDEVTAIIGLNAEDEDDPKDN